MAIESQRKSETPIEIYAIAAAGILVGVLLLIHPVIWVTWWWEPLIDALRDGERTNVWKPAVVMLSILGGLAILFGSLQPARAYARSDAMLRRFIYGYNAFLTGVLVFIMLVIGNIGIHIWAPRYLDATEGGFYSLSDVTRTFVKELERPATVYVVLGGDDVWRNTMMLLGQMSEMNPRSFSFEEIPPIANDPKFRDLKRRFPQLGGEGLIVAMGDQPETNYTFIPATELEIQDRDPRTGRPLRREYAGEVRLMQELNHLSVNKKKPVVYFTQGHGEPDTNSAGDAGMSQLRVKLMSENYDIRTLQITAGVDAKDFKVPDDADLVVVAGPQRSMADSIPALEAYLKSPRGRMLVFLGPTPADRNSNKMLETGLEKLLEEFNVEITNEAVYTFGVPEGGGLNRGYNPEVVFVSPFDSAVDSRHPVAVNFKDKALLWFVCRQVRTGSKNQFVTAEPVFGSYGEVWTQSDTAKSPLSQKELMNRDRGEYQRLVKRDPLPIVVAVSERSPDPSKADKPPTPKLLVFGSSMFLTNPFQGRGAGAVNADLVRSSIDWCRERYSSIGIQPKTYNSFIPGKVSVPKMVVIPTVLMLMAILGFGLVVWNVRRR